MNTRTGTIYRTPEEIADAKARGEPLVEISETVAALVDAGRVSLNRRQRRARAAENRRIARRQFARARIAAQTLKPTNQSTH